MTNPLSAKKAELVADLEATLAAFLPGEKVTVLPYEPREVTGDRITVTVVSGPFSSERFVFVTRIYCPTSDPKKGVDRLEDAAFAIADELPAPWEDPVCNFGWDERLDLFSGQANISTPRGLGD